MQIFKLGLSNFLNVAFLLNRKLETKPIRNDVGHPVYIRIRMSFLKFSVLKAVLENLLNM